VARDCRRTRRSTSPLWPPAFRIEIVPLRCVSAEFPNTVIRNAEIVAQFLKRHGKGGIPRPRATLERLALAARGASGASNSGRSSSAQLLKKPSSLFLFRWLRLKGNQFESAAGRMDLWEAAHPPVVTLSRENHIRVEDKACLS
jgi:hypothetical protein